MNGETQFMIHQLRILHREIQLEAAKPEGHLQLATMIKLFQHDIPLYIEKLKRLEELENEHLGKSNGHRQSTTYTASVR